MFDRLAIALSLTLTLALLFDASGATLAKEAVHPRNSGIGLVPPPGFSPATAFSGFQSPERNASIVIVEMPAEAYEQIAGTMNVATFEPSGYVAKGDGADRPLAGPVEWARIEEGGKDAGTGTPARVVQVVRFEGPGYVRIVGLTRVSHPDFAERARRPAASVTLR